MQYFSAVYAVLIVNQWRFVSLLRNSVLLSLSVSGRTIVQKHDVWPLIYTVVGSEYGVKEKKIYNIYIYMYANF